MSHPDRFNSLVVGESSRISSFQLRIRERESSVKPCLSTRPMNGFLASARAPAARSASTYLQQSVGPPPQSHAQSYANTFTPPPPQSGKPHPLAFGQSAPLARAVPLHSPEVRCYYHKELAWPTCPPVARTFYASYLARCCMSRRISFNFLSNPSMCCECASTTSKSMSAQSCLSTHHSNKRL